MPGATAPGILFTFTPGGLGIVFYDRSRYHEGMDEIMDFLATQPYNRHIFDATRTSPFGYYATCSCGVVSPEYRESHEAAWEDWVLHKEAMNS